MIGLRSLRRTLRINTALLSALVLAGNAYALPCATTYENYREELVDYGLTPVDCETLNMEKLVWSELCKDGSDKGKRFKVYWTIWNEEKIGKQFKLPVLFTMEKGLCVFSSSMVKDLKKEEVKDAFHKEINQTAKK